MWVDLATELGGGGVSGVRGEFGESWFRAVCTAAGLTVWPPSRDVDGLDFLVSSGKGRMIGVQVKATESPLWSADGDQLKWDLDAGAFKKAIELGPTPVLVVFALSRSLGDWTAHNHSLSFVRATGYFALLTPQPLAGRTTVRVSLPRDNMVTAAAVRRLVMEEG